MGQPHSRPAQLLVSWVRQQADSCAPGTAIPTERQLADRFDVSVRTVNRMLGALQAEGLVYRVPGRGTFTGKPPVSPELTQHHAPSWNSLADMLAKQISTGTLKRNEPLPPVKHTAKRFRVTPSTVTRAYAHLAAQGQAVRVGRSYWVGQLGSITRASATKQVHFFLRETSIDTSGICAPASINRVVQSLEKELQVHGFRVLFHAGDTFDTHRDEWLKSRQFPYGLYFGILHGTDAYEQVVRSLAPLRAAAGVQYPRVVAMLRGLSLKLDPSADVLNLGNLRTVIARAAATFLCEHRFETVTLLIDLPNLLYGDVSAYLRVVPELQRINPAVACRAILRTGPGAADRTRFFDQFYRNYHPDRILGIMGKYRKYTLDDIAGMIELTEEWTGIRERLATQPGAWLFANASDAYAAQDWARSHGIDVPRRVSIVSFEDDLATVLRNISVCIPDWETTGYLMAHSIIGDFPIAHTSHGYIRPEAIVMERGTTPG